MKLPFEQEIVLGKIKRIFSPEVESEELKWHQDLKDRKVEIIESGNWSFQIENEIPKILKNNEIIFIPKLTWHRVLKGTEKLIVEIEEFDS